MVVPLAGPDFELADGAVKANLSVDGEPLLRRALSSRFWAADVNPADIVFVLQDSTRSRMFASTMLAEWFPTARRVFLSDYTRGAALSSLAGIATARSFDEPICLDLADILFRCDSDPRALLADPVVGGVGLVFKSDNPIYSYLRIGPDGSCIEAAEKRVISNNASAGVYFFASPVVYLRALAYALERPEEHTYKDLFFVCPLLNGIISQNLKVYPMAVSDVRDIKVS